MTFLSIERTSRAIALLALAGATFLLSGCTKGAAASRPAQSARTVENYDSALAVAEEASKQDPHNAQYKLRVYQLRFEAAQFHVKQGIKYLEQHENQSAAKEFETALEIDPSCMVARQELEHVRKLPGAEFPAQQGPATMPSGRASAAGPTVTAPSTTTPAAPAPAPQAQAETAPGGLMGMPPTLRPFSREPMSLQLHEDARIVFRTIGKLAGVNVIFDPEFPDKRISIDLANVTIQQALNVACVEARAFWKPVTSNIIMVLPDTAGKRRQEEEQILKKVYLLHTQTPQELTEITTSLQQMLELRHVQAVPRDNAILIRDTPDKVLLAERLIQDSDRGRPEVVVQISILQVRRDRARSLGIQPGGTSALVFAPVSPLGPAGAVALSNLANISSGDFALTIPNVVASALMSDSTTRLIQNPEVRVSDGESARLRVGDRIPIATGSFASTVGAGVGVNTQFQYIDVGVNIDLVPHVLPDHSVSMKLGVEVSSINGRVNIGGVEQPVISQRRIDHEIRLQEGEVSVLGGLAERSQSKSVTGWPGLSRLPLLRYLFSGEDVSNAENEVLIVVTPRLVRGRERARESLQALSVGTDSGLVLREQEEALAPVAAGAQQPGYVEAKAVMPVGLPPEEESLPTLQLEPAIASLKTGESTTIRVRIENVKDLFSSSLMFRYDPHLLSVEDVQHGDFLSGGMQEVAIVQRIDKDKGEAGIYTTRQPNTAGIDGEGVMLSLVVKRLAEGPTTMKLAEVVASNSRQRPMRLKVARSSVDLP